MVGFRWKINEIKIYLYTLCFHIINKEESVIYHRREPVIIKLPGIKKVKMEQRK